jgi:hypothetical protein
MSAKVPSRTFCFCLPVRLGVFVLTILGMFGGGLLAVVGWMQSLKLQGTLPKSNEVAMFIHSGLYTLLALVSIFGFIGAIVRHRTMVYIFFVILVAHLTFSIFSGAFALYNLFHSIGDDAIQKCIDSAANTTDGQTPTSPDDCRHGFDVVRGVAVGVFILVWLLEIWGCFITNSYVNQLEDEMEANTRWPKQPDVEAGSTR